MEHILKFQKIIRDGIFEIEFKDLKKNNEIKLCQSKISVLYGANGTGKTSLINLLKKMIRISFNIIIITKLMGIMYFLLLKIKLKEI